MFAQLGRPDWHLALFYIELAEFSIPIDVSWVLDNVLNQSSRLWEGDVESANSADLPKEINPS
jgi:hypothetical protein